jgi:hypothetical protein
MTIRHTPQMRYFVRESYSKVKSPQKRASGVSELICGEDWKES